MSSLPADVVQFARSYIRTLEDLDVFIVCVDHRDRWWDAAEIARRVTISERAAVDALDHLAKANLLDIRISEAIHYRFHPGADDLASQAGVFIAAYHRNPVELVKLIARSAVSNSVRDFADAFRMRRRRNDRR
jgi:hypothetical protein